MPVEYRWITTLDEHSGRALLELYDDALSSGTYLGYPEPIEPSERVSVVHRLNEALGERRILLFGIYSGERLVGTAILTPNKLPNCKHIAEISKGAIHSELRARGILPDALLHVAERARLEGCDMLTLDVRAGTEPHSIWSRLGFKEYGILHDYARVNGESFSGAYMYQYTDELIERLRALTTGASEASSPRPSSRKASMMPEEVFKVALREELMARVTMTHPIIKEVLSGEPNWELLRFMTLQGYQLTKHFLSYIEILYHHCPRGVHKRRLLYNMFEEETGRFSSTDNHVTLMQNFIRAIGIDEATRDAAQPLPSTKRLIDYRMDLVRNRYTFHMGAAAVMIGSEGQNLETAAGDARHDLLPRVYGLTAEDLSFFSVHQKEDVGHVKEGISLVAAVCQNARMQQEALEAVRTTCDLFYGMYEGISSYWHADASRHSAVSAA